MARCSLYSKSTSSKAVMGMMFDYRAEMEVEVEVDVENELEVGNREPR